MLAEVEKLGKLLALVEAGLAQFSNSQVLKEAKALLAKNGSLGGGNVGVTSNILRELTLTEKQELADRLLACPILNNAGGRQSVINGLPEYIKNSINLASVTNARQEMVAILVACLEYPEGLPALMQSVRFYDLGTIKLNRVEDYLKQLGLSI